MAHTPEHHRLHLDAQRTANWKRWGPYVSERQWGTVREDYSSNGDCWTDFPFEHAHQRAYRWGEDGLMGWTDRQCRLCFAVALWNGNDPILKERLFGLTNSQGNHGEDVKERYWYLDSTPTHSYAKAAYHYPHSAYPYQALRDENARRGKDQMEFEVEDTGCFNEGRYFDVVTEYAKETDNNTCMRITVTNHGPVRAELHLLPTLWFRNTWVWGCEHEGCTSKPWLWNEDAQPTVVQAQHETLQRFTWQLGASPDGTLPTLLFTENATNTRALYNDARGTKFTKDAFHRYVVNGESTAINPKRDGTKACAHYRLTLAAGESQTVLLRLAEGEGTGALDASGISRVFEERMREADAFYDSVLDASLGARERVVARQAYAGLLWTKQFYHYIVDAWLEGDPLMVKPPEQRKQGRNKDWQQHFFARDVLSMPDKWEYPWFAAWDSCFHMIPLAEIDPDEAKAQLEVFLREWYMHPNGQVPAYEFAFGDVNPPVHAWAVWRVYKMTAPRGHRDRRFLASCFQKLLLNFTWWVNRKDPHGNNVFGGGFLGLDNIGVFDRSQPMPGGGTLTQSDATAWMAFYCHTMLAMALELADSETPEAGAYADMASKFFEHFVHIADAMNHLGGTGLWDDRDGFYYDHMATNGDSTPLRVQSLVGLLPMIAVETFKRGRIRKHKGFKKRLDWFLAHRHDLRRTITYMVTDDDAEAPEGKVNDELFLLALPSRSRLEKMLKHLLDEREFFSPFGVRSLSKKHEREPYVLDIDGQRLTVRYRPAESETRMFGGNSNWRGPIWFPTNYLLLEALQRYHHFYGDSFKVECPTGSGVMRTLGEVAQELASRLSKLCPPDEAGRVLFYEYFDGDSGRGCGASHQTGWTALVTRCLREAVRDCRGFDA